CPFNHTPTSETYTLSLHDALPILSLMTDSKCTAASWISDAYSATFSSLSLLRLFSARILEKPITVLSGVRSSWLIFEMNSDLTRSEEHTSELQSRENLVCRLLLEK